MRCWIAFGSREVNLRARSQWWARAATCYIVDSARQLTPMTSSSASTGQGIVRRSHLPPLHSSLLLPIHSPPSIPISFCPPPIPTHPTPRSISPCPILAKPRIFTLPFPHHPATSPILFPPRKARRATRRTLGEAGTTFELAGVQVCATRGARDSCAAALSLWRRATCRTRTDFGSGRVSACGAGGWRRSTRW